MSTIEHEIADWAATRHPWQQYALRRIASGRPFGPTEIAPLADEIIQGKYSVPVKPALQASDVSGLVVTGRTVSVTSIRDVTNVNALVPAQELTFAETGLTVVFGDNGSGKSGYARIVKDVASARHHEPIHPNVFEPNAGAPQRAEIAFRVDGTPQTCNWPSASSDLRAISFYDEACGDVYLSTESELTYRPSSLAIIDDLIELCDAVRGVLEERVKQINGARRSLPSVAKGTSGESFLATLNARTTNTELDSACELASDWADRYSWLIQEEGRLRATDPGKERIRLETLASEIDAMATHLAAAAQALSDSAVGAAMRARRTAIELRAAADIASSGSFDAEPLPGIGSATWRSLWDAARRYSEQEAYPGRDFPITSADAHCVFCQQVLGPDASDRLARFHAFLTDTTAKSAADAESALASITNAIHNLDLTPKGISSALVHLESEASELGKAATDWLLTAEQRRVGLLRQLQGNDVTLASLGHSPASQAEGLAQALRQRAMEVEVDGFSTTIAAVAAEKNDLQSRKALSDGRPDLEAEIERLKTLKSLSDAKKLTDTTHISRKATELTEAHVTTLVRDRFTRESDRLKLEHIELKRTGGSKGKLHHRPSLLGAKTVQPVVEVLSEGEQTALGLAGYFTEAHFDTGRSALVLDDPVTSLDHIRRAQVAESLARYAAERQVIVFTHDLAFLRDLMRAAEASHVPFTERTVQRRGSTPGQVAEGYPWKAKDVKRRFDELTTLLAQLKRDRENLAQDVYEEECAKWAGKLSETWERIISLELLAPVVDPVTEFIRPQSFRVLSRITESDNEKFQQSYSRCSTWLRRHDKSQSLNYVAPEPAELEAELALAKGWHDRVRKYTT